MITLADYYNGDCYDEVNNYPEWMLKNDYDVAYREHELQEEINALERERKAALEEREYQIQRIARDARSESIKTSVIYKFFNDYNIDVNEQVIFWTAFFSWWQ